MDHRLFQTAWAYIKYKGAAPQFTFLMHRVSGLGILAFLTMHILVESTAYLMPEKYGPLNEALHQPVVRALELGMAFLVIFHGVNGFRIAWSDLFPGQALTNGNQNSRQTWGIALLLWLPTLILILRTGFR